MFFSLCVKTDAPDALYFLAGIGDGAIIIGLIIFGSEMLHWIFG